VLGTIRGARGAGGAGGALDELLPYSDLRVENRWSGVSLAHLVAEACISIACLATFSLVSDVPGGDFFAPSRLIGCRADPQTSNVLFGVRDIFFLLLRGATRSRRLVYSRHGAKLFSPPRRQRRRSLGRYVSFEAFFSSFLRPLVRRGRWFGFVTHRADAQPVTDLGKQALERVCADRAPCGRSDSAGSVWSFARQRDRAAARSS